MVVYEVSGDCPKHKSIKACQEAAISDTSCLWCEHANMCITSNYPDTHDFKVNGCRNKDLLKQEETTIEDNWKGSKEALTSKCQEVLGLKKRHHKEWITIETLDKIEERKNKNAATNNSRTRAEKVQAQAE
ncbi:unnamed protein product [Schistosoma margrebowiei]|uniref:PSI domain-containing protein n=1 Tax=Schistosoma margrebowiei TaxID=48269 RepID=A0A3P8F7A5_9TREM|nr:unnamed protein product [Schistosoma margrebowiei]